MRTSAVPSKTYVVAPGNNAGGGCCGRGPLILNLIVVLLSWRVDVASVAYMVSQSVLCPSARCMQVPSPRLAPPGPRLHSGLGLGWALR